MKCNTVRIVTGAENFQDRVDEITSSVSYDSVNSVVARIKDALYKDKNIPALCAPQIDVPLRLFVVRNGQKDESRFKVFVNPMIVSGKNLHLSREVSASLPGKEYIIPRKTEINIAYQTADGHPTYETFIGAYAEVVQQMIEMLDGITLADYGLDLDAVGGAKAFDKASQKDKIAVLEMYMNTLKDYHKELAEEIENDPILKGMNNAIEFTASVLSGDTEIKNNAGVTITQEIPKE